ncbi:MAG: WYL domain-containing protein [Bacteroidota bacterium]
MALDPVPLPRSAEQLLRHLDRDGRPTKKDAAALLGVTPRQVARVVETLREAGHPVRDEPDPADGRRLRYYLDPEHQRRGLHLDTLDEGEVLALTVAAEAARSALRGTPLQAPLDRAFVALLDAIDEANDGDGVFSFDPEAEPNHWHFGGHAQLPDPGVFTALRRAASGGVRVRIDYTDAKGAFSPGRTVSPLGFGRVRGGWVLVAYCHERDALREFALPSVSHVATLTEAVHQPHGFSLRRYFAQRFGALEGGEPVEVRLWVSPERAVYFQRRRYHPSQALTEAEDGGLTVAYRVPGGAALDEVRAFVASWGPHVVVEAPEALADMLAADARATAMAYGRAAFDAVLDRVPSVEPDPSDRIE